MTLVLQGIALDDQPMSQPLIGRFDERGGTLGRSDTVTFTLPDPERTISRIQAQVLHREEGYWIENVSAAIPILHNGRPLSAGMRVMLREGDELRVGGYTLRAAFEGDESSTPILRGRTIIRSFGTAAAGAAQTVVGGENLRRGFLRSVGVTPPVPERSPAELLRNIRSALEAVLDRLDPAKLKTALGSQSVLESLRPARHKARLWEIYVERFRLLRLETQGDLHRFIGEALRDDPTTLPRHGVDPDDT
jgi:predicted component of type VI protein secretion system